MAVVPTKHMKQLCEKLGPKYSIRMIDTECVIYRDFENGFDIEISGANTSSEKKLVTIFLWRDKCKIEKTVEQVPQFKIGDCVEELYYESLNLADQ